MGDDETDTKKPKSASISMTAKQPAVFTFHKVREECEQGNAEAWRAFLNFYSPLCLHLLKIYGSDENEAARSAIWVKTLGALTENNFEKFRATARQSEREFLVEVRALLFDTALAQRRVQERAASSAGEASNSEGAGKPALNFERTSKIVEGLPLLHQEVLWFKLAGYTDATIESILRTTPRVAHAALDRLEPDFAAARELASDGCLWPDAWLALLAQARAAKKEDCPPLHQLLRIHDGQVSWYDKEPTETRVAGCVHCLESGSALHEVSYWRRAAPALPSTEIEEWLRGLPVVARAARCGGREKVVAEARFRLMSPASLCARASSEATERCACLAGAQISNRKSAERRCNDPRNRRGAACGDGAQTASTWATIRPCGCASEPPRRGCNRL
jgi:hypothetical protein